MNTKHKIVGLLGFVHIPKFDFQKLEALYEM